MDEDVPKVWVPLGNANHPKPSATSLTTVQIATLKRTFTRQFEYKIYCEEGVLIQAGLIRDEEFEPFVTPSASWGEILRSTQIVVEPNKVPFSTMFGRRQPLFQQVKVTKKTSPEVPSSQEQISSSPDLAAAISSSLEPLRMSSEDLRDPLTGPITKQAEGLDHAPKAKLGYSANYLALPDTLPGGFVIDQSSDLQKNCEAFMAVRPLMLEKIGKSFDSFRDPLEIHGVTLRNMIKAMNASYVLACKADRLDDACAEGLDREKALQWRIQELEGEYEAEKQKSLTPYNEKMEAVKRSVDMIRRHEELEATYERSEKDSHAWAADVGKLSLARDQETQRTNEAEAKAKEVKESAELLTQKRLEEAFHQFEETPE
ncbi:hypothetical protein LIER_22225 [Lithospermum erythrorhizon]|uniref:Uncharacterized protein n=1 Tax=Lithospermum erythrorhizon TaxID=34254 RepID=A0AAV3QUM7_LITER